MDVFDTHHFVLPLPQGHRFPMEKYRLLREAVAAHLPDIRWHEAPAASEGELALAHTPSDVSAIKTGNVEPRIQREIGFPWSMAMAERACRSVGGTIAACRSALLGAGVAANIAGGTHHAYADHGSGFCVFNDAAVAARLMQAEAARHRRNRPPLQVAIIDLDVHQGNGTARIFQDDSSVFTLSLHGERNFPFRKERSDLDVPLPDGCGDDEYLHTLELALEELTQRFEPEFLIYLAGADVHEGDRLGRLKLSGDGIEARDRRVFNWAWQKRLPLAMVMAGGYGHRIEDTVAVQLNSYRIASEFALRWQQSITVLPASHTEIVTQAANESSSGWQNRRL